MYPSRTCVNLDRFAISLATAFAALNRPWEMSDGNNKERVTERVVILVSDPELICMWMNVEHTYHLRDQPMHYTKR